MSYPYTITLAGVKKLNPCAPSFERASRLLPKRRKIDAAQARELGCTYDDIIWVASTLAMHDESLARRLTHYLNDNAKAVLHIFEGRRPNDSRPRKAIEACDAFLNGTGSESEWEQAAQAARAAWAAWAARAARAARGAWAARAAWGAWGEWAAWGAWGEWGARAAWGEWAAWAAWGAWGARDAFRDWQFNRLIYWLVEECPTPMPMPQKGEPALPEIAKLEKAA